MPNPELAIRKTHDHTVFAETSRCRLLIGCEQLNANSTRRRWCAIQHERNDGNRLTLQPTSLDLGQLISEKQKTGGIARRATYVLSIVEVTRERTRVESPAKDNDHEHDTISERLDRLDRYLAAAVA